jgi:hypothetical protein
MGKKDMKGHCPKWSGDRNSFYILATGCSPVTQFPTTEGAPIE